MNNLNWMFFSLFNVWINNQNLLPMASCGGSNKENINFIFKDYDCVLQEVGSKLWPC